MFAVVTSVLFNLITDVVGGVRFTQIELETARPAGGDADAGLSTRFSPSASAWVW